jgi:hypothetical protein
MLKKMDNLESGQNYLRDAIMDIKTSFAKSVTLEDYKKEQKLEVDALKDQIEEIKLSRSKLLGIMIGANVVIAALWSALEMWLMYVSGHIH